MWLRDEATAVNYGHFGVIVHNQYKKIECNVYDLFIRLTTVYFDNYVQFKEKWEKAENEIIIDKKIYAYEYHINYSHNLEELKEMPYFYLDGNPIDREILENGYLSYTRKHGAKDE